VLVPAEKHDMLKRGVVGFGPVTWRVGSRGPGYPGDRVTKRLAGGGHVGLVAFHTTTCSGLMSGPRAGRSLRGVLVPAENHDTFEF